MIRNTDNGRTEAQLSPEEVMDKILDKSVGKDEHLRAEVRQIIDRLCQDAFQPGVRSLLVARPQRLGDKNFRVYRLNPRHMRNIALSRQAQQYRVIFFATKEKLCIMDVTSYQQDYEATKNSLYR